MKVFYRVLDRDDVAISLLIYMVDYGRERRRFSRPGRAGDEHQAPHFVCYRGEYRRQAEFGKGPDRVRNNTGYNPDRVALLEDIDAKTPQTLHAVADIDLVNLFEMLLLPVRHHRKSHLERLVLRHARNARKRLQFARNTNDWVRPGPQVQVRRTEAHSHSQKIVDSSRHKKGEVR